MSMVMEMVMVMFPDEEGKISGTMMFARRYVPRENGPTCTNHIAILAKLGPATHETVRLGCCARSPGCWAHELA